MMDIESHYQLCEEQEEGKICICEDIIEEAQSAEIDAQLEDMRI